jgi:hypothetical protein
MRSRKLLALLFCLITFPAIAGYMTLLGAGVGNISPTVSWVAGTDAFPDTSLTYSGPSLSTMFDSTGKLTYKPNNLALNTAALGTQSVTVQVGTNYLISFASGGGSIALSGAGAGTVTSASPVKITASTTTLTLTVTGTVTNAVVAAVTWETLPSQRPGDQVITTSSAYYGPRIDYDPNTLAVKGLLIEEARTNRALWSSDLSNAAWGLSDTTGTLPTVTANAGAALTGLNTATKVSINRSNVADRNGVYQLFTGTAVPYTGTFWVKAFDVGDVGKQITVRPFDGTTVGTVATITLTSSYQQVSATQTMAAVVCTFLVGYTENVGSQTGAISFLVSGGQIEAGSFATSYIPTAAASVTRVADVAQFTGPALTALQGIAGAAIVEMTALPGATAGSGIIIGGASGVAFMFENSNTVAVTYDVSSSPTLAAATAGTSSFTGGIRAGVSWNANARSVVLGGGTVGTVASGFTGSRTSVGLGSYAGGSQPANGWYQSFAIYNQRLPDATLQAKSVVGASYAANDNGIRYAFADNDNLPIHWRVAL